MPGDEIFLLALRVVSGKTPARSRNNLPPRRPARFATALQRHPEVFSGPTGTKHPASPFPGAAADIRH